MLADTAASVPSPRAPARYVFGRTRKIRAFAQEARNLVRTAARSVPSGSSKRRWCRDQPDHDFRGPRIHTRSRAIAASTIFGMCSRGRYACSLANTERPPVPALLRRSQRPTRRSRPSLAFARCEKHADRRARVFPLRPRSALASSRRWKHDLRRASPVVFRVRKLGLLIQFLS